MQLLSKYSLESQRDKTLFFPAEDDLNVCRIMDGNKRRCCKKATGLPSCITHNHNV